MHSTPLHTPAAFANSPTMSELPFEEAEAMARQNAMADINEDIALIVCQRDTNTEVQVSLLDLDVYLRASRDGGRAL